MTLQEYGRKITFAEGKRNALQNELHNAQSDVDTHTERLKNIELARAFIQEVAVKTQEQIQFVISDVVNLALSTCFGDEYEFGIDFEIKRGRTEATLLFRKDGHDIDPMTETGGGAVDLAAFALRIATWSLGSTNNVLIFDEPFRFLSKDLQPRAAEIVHTLSEKLGLQIIMVTHSTDLVEHSDRIFTVTKKKGVSKVEVKENV